VNISGLYGQDGPVDTEEGLYSALMGVASGLELKSTLRRIVTNAVYLSDASYGALGVLDIEGRIQDFIHVGIPDEVSKRIGDTPLGKGLLGELSVHPTPLRLAHINEHPASAGFPESHPVMSSFLGVPVRIRGVVFGNLYLTDKKGGGAFTDEDEQAVIAFATAAAVAIENARLYELATQKEKWQRAVSEIATAVLSGDDSGEVLELIAERSRLLTGASAALIALPDSSGVLTIEIVNADADSADSVGRLRGWLGTPAPTHSILRRSFALGGSIIEDHCAIWSEVTADLRDEPVAAVALPLRTVDKVLGVLLLIWPHGSLIAANEVIDRVESFAGHAALTLVLAAAQQDKENLAVLEDRERIGRDLHDFVIQRVFATGMLLNGVVQSGSLTAEASAKIDQAVEQLDETIREIRQTIFDLHTQSPELTIQAKISQEVSSASVALGFPAQLTLTGPLDSTVGPVMGDHLLAVIRESLINCAKHAHATEVGIRVAVDSPELVCEVMDNGTGYAPGTHISGVANMESRAAELGGELVIGARPDEQQGTQVRWSVPLV
jgi:signal transduction histidine kinase